MGHIDGISIQLVSKVAWKKCEVPEGEGESTGVLQCAVCTAAEVLTRAGETW